MNMVHRMMMIVMIVMIVATTIATTSWSVKMDVDWSLTRLVMTMAIAMQVRVWKREGIANSRC